MILDMAEFLQWGYDLQLKTIGELYDCVNCSDGITAPTIQELQDIFNINGEEDVRQITIEQAAIITNCQLYTESTFDLDEFEASFAEP